jgi:CspA family cold shock protein
MRPSEGAVLPPGFVDAAKPTAGKATARRLSESGATCTWIRPNAGVDALRNSVLHSAMGPTRTRCGPTKAMRMPIGTVKFFATDKGFGFIAPEDGGQDVFVHISEVERSGMRSLQEGQRVSFETKIDARKGKPNATNLRAV